MSTADRQEPEDWKSYTDKLTMAEIADLFVTAQDNTSTTGFQLFKDEKLNSDRRQKHREIRERISGQILRAKDIDPSPPLTDYQHHQILEAARAADRILMKSFISKMSKGEFVFIIQGPHAVITAEYVLIGEFLELLLERFGFPRNPKEVAATPAPPATRKNAAEADLSDYILIRKRTALLGLLTIGAALLVFSAAFQSRSN
jgi:hypothetical protein